MKHAAPKLDAAAWTMLLVLSVLWGGSFIYVAIAIVEIPPMTLVAARVTIACAVLLVWLRAKGIGLPRDKALWRDFAAMALLNNLIPFGLIFWAQTEIDAGLAAIVNATTPLWTLVFAHFMTADERLTGARAAGVAIGVAGVVVLVGPSALAGVGGALVPQLAVVAATVSYALALVHGRRLRAVDPAVFATCQFACATPAALALSVIVDRSWTLPVPSPLVIGVVLAFALLSTAVGYLLYFGLIRRSGAGNASLVTMLVPPSAMALGAVFLGERPEPLALAGFALIAAGLVVVDGRLLRR